MSNVLPAAFKLSTRVTLRHLYKYKSLVTRPPPKHLKYSIQRYLADVRAPDTQWVHHVHLLNPVVYQQKSVVSVQWLLDMSTSQLQFRDRLAARGFLESTSPDDLIAGYHEFLNLIVKKCRPGVQPIPTLGQDLVWHAHMMDHDLYSSDTTAIFGKILDHHIFPPFSQKTQLLGLADSNLAHVPLVVPIIISSSSSSTTTAPTTPTKRKDDDVDGCYNSSFQVVFPHACSASLQHAVSAASTDAAATSADDGGGGSSGCGGSCGGGCGGCSS